MRGHLEDLSTDKNSGNFVESFKLLARHVSVTSQHLQKVQKYNGYIVISLPSESELVCLLGDSVRTVDQNVEKAK